MTPGTRSLRCPPALPSSRCGATARAARASNGVVLAVVLMFLLAWLPATGPRAQAPAELPPPEEITAADLIESMRSDVRIIARENHSVEEFRVGNNVYMVKVKPQGAPPYYLIDEDGSGDLQWRRGSDLERTSVPHWAVVRW